MTPEQVIKHFDGEQAAADALGCTRQIVNFWLNSGKIPLKTQAFIQLKSGGKLKAEIQASGIARRKNGS